MRCNLKNLSEKKFDLAIIGGGVYGLFTAWDAALRGLSVALVEKGDFGSGTSFNSFKIIHGGLRYLQHADFVRLSQSMRERAVFMNMAPHLVHPLPFLIPAYGHFMKGKEALSAALLLNGMVGLLSGKLGFAVGPMPRSRIVSREECLRLFPGMPGEGLTGGAVYHDGQMCSSERFAVSLARSAADAGAELANHVEATGFLTANDRVTGVAVRDVLSGEKWDIRADSVVNAAGPWIGRVLARLERRTTRFHPTFSRAFNLLINRQIAPEYAAGIYSRIRFLDRDAVLKKGSRVIFVAPWKNRSMLGTVHLPDASTPDDALIAPEEIQAFLDEVREACPDLRVGMEEVVRVYSGRLPAMEGGEDVGGVQLMKEHLLCDHAVEDRLGGLVSVCGVKYTESRRVAEETVDLVFRKMGTNPPKCLTTETPVHGGRMSRFDDFMREEGDRLKEKFDRESVHHLLHGYGSSYPEVLESLNAAETGTDALVGARIRHAVRHEMARTLSDVLIRRLDSDFLDHDKDQYIRMCAAVMEKEMKWDPARTDREVRQTLADLASLKPRRDSSVAVGSAGVR